MKQKEKGKRKGNRVGERKRANKQPFFKQRDSQKFIQEETLDNNKQSTRD